MKDYKQLLKELPSNTVVCALGDFDPPTVGHELLVKTVKRLAESKGSAHVIFTSPSKTLQEDKKSQYLKLMFPKTNFTSIEESFTSSVEQLKKKYKNVIVVVGTEQSTGLRKALKESVQFVAINEKNPDSDTSKMKSFATKALYEEFKKKLPSTIRELDGRRLMNDVRTGMGLEPVKEQLNLVKDTLREQYFRGEIFNEGDIVESNGVQYTIVKRGSNHLLLKEESGELVSKWIQDVKSITEGAVQPTGTDQVIPAGPDKVEAKDQTDTPNGKPKGLKKGYLTFYNYTKDNTNDFKVAKMEQYQPHSVSDKDKDSESDLDADNQKLQVFDPTEVGHAVTPKKPEKGAHHLRRMKLQYAFKEHIELDETKRMSAQVKLQKAFEREQQKSEASRKRAADLLAGKNTDTSRNGPNNFGGSGERVTPVTEGLGRGREDDEGQGSGYKPRKDFFNDRPHTVHIDGKPWKKFSNAGQANKAADTLKSQGKKVSVIAHFKEQAELLETALNPNDPHGDYKAKSKAIQDIQLDPSTHKDPELKTALMQRKADLEKEYSKFKESLDEAKKKPVCPECGKHECDCGEERPGIGTETSMSKDPFFKEDEDMSDKEIDSIVDTVTDADIEDLYEEEDLTVIYEDTGEELPVAPEEAEIELMEVLSRQERMKAKFRFRKTAAKRERSTKVALKRYSNTATINKRARRLAIKLIKARLLRGRDLSTVSVQEKERIEKTIANRKNAITRIAAKLVGRIRRVEKSRMSHGQVTKGSTPSVF